jgi:hypothetical protein
MPIPALRRPALIAALFLPAIAAACLPALTLESERRTRVSVDRHAVLPPVVNRPPATLLDAVRSLDTLFNAQSETAEAVLGAIRDVRTGRMQEALERLVPVAAGTDLGSDLAREVLGQLLFHHGAWGALAQGTTEAGPLFQFFASVDREEWWFPGDSVVVPLTLSAAGTPVVEVLVEGKPRRFWIDTGAGLTVVSSSLAEAVGIQVGDSPGRTGTSTTRQVEALGAVIEELQVGGLRVRNHPAMVLNAGDLEFQLPGVAEVMTIDGILGWPFIRSVDLTLDHIGGRLILREPRESPTSDRNLFWLGYPTVAVRTDSGEELLLGLDTGASTTTLGPRYLEVTGARTEGTRTRHTGGAGGFEAVEVQVLGNAAFFLDGRRITLTDVDVGPPPGGGVLEMSGVIGSDLGGLGSIRIDVLNGRFEFASGAGMKED